MDVTVDLQVKFPTVGGPDTVPLLLAQGATANAGEAFIFTTEDLYPGDLLVDVTAVVDRKAELIRFYRSQMQHRDWVHFALGLNAFNVRLMPRENRPRYAEAFFVVPLDDYMKICASYFDQGPAACYSEPNYLEGVVAE